VSGATEQYSTFVEHCGGVTVSQTAIRRERRHQILGAGNGTGKFESEYFRTQTIIHESRQYSTQLTATDL